NALLSLYLEKKRYSEVVELLKETVELNPEDSNAHYKLGLMHEYNKDYEAATQQYARAVELNKEHAKALNAMGRVYLRTGRFDAARESLEAARAIDPNMEETKVLLANIKDEFSNEPRKAAAGKKGSKKGKKPAKGAKKGAKKPAAKGETKKGTKKPAKKAPPQKKE
ncbi:MAG TPA: tetratricopeptide repeat protein, partial [Verrucomicrobiae bacterium]|nr:tetratricopeptide repeat protein [Verrucomicrobiae bacterium]